ncbi:MULTISPECIES: hypothetical protein [Micrococcaceae]|uniref:Uncharacterized protein n=1 Tax=Glutamicibacter soli TaxID=453836 RepID=A0A6L9G5U4_9MICC|nr:hypothetical protein [Glutamicibacter soli]NAZ16323.1 hypothetical protein [Glutamicibacter soli]
MKGHDESGHTTSWWKQAWREGRNFLALLWPKTGREHGYFWTLAIPLVTIFILWRWSIAPMATVWGDVGTWVAGLATLGGLIYASLSLQGQTKQREAEALRHIEDEQNRRLAHAREVAVSSRWTEDKSKPTRMRVELELINASPYPIDGVVLLIPSGGMETEDYHNIEMVIGTVLPGERIPEKSDWVDNADIPFSLLIDCVQVRFTDAWGTHWLRGPGHLKEMSEPARTC